MNKVNLGLVHGKFQGLHLGHMEYILAAYERSEHLVIGITNPDPELTKEDESDVKRSSAEANPFSYFERFLMVRDSLLERGVPRGDFDIVPFPINFPAKLLNYAPKGAVYFTTIYDEWNRKKVKVLKELGLRVVVLWERSMGDRLTTGTEVRRRIREGGVWEHLVPRAVVKIIKEYELEKRF